MYFYVTLVTSKPVKKTKNQRFETYVKQTCVLRCVLNCVLDRVFGIAPACFYDHILGQGSDWLGKGGGLVLGACHSGAWPASVKIFIDGAPVPGLGPGLGGHKLVVELYLIMVPALFS